MLAGQALEQLGGKFGFGVGHARYGLVKQQQLRVLHQQHADLEELFLSVGQQARRTIDRSSQANGVQHLGDAIFLLAAEPRPQAGPY
ncbi:hypothetical protein D3C76_1593700 [compost metagenome]